ncbi:hypothetical protein INR49_025490 [Caranx melampygus]|nr:hypothetical protein INR49_025490 [Caranx melampygus]
MERGGEMRSLDQVEREGQKSIQSETTNKFIYVNVYPAEQCELFTQLQLSDDQTGQTVALLATNSNTGMITGFEETPAMETRIEGDGHAEFITDVDKLLNISPAVNTSSTLNPQLASQTDPSTTIHNPTRSKIRAQTKSDSQLRMMKAAFHHCQYPNSDEFDYLAPAIGLPRCTLVKWFSDTRYAIKKRKPSWVNEEQYKKMLSTISYWQHVEMCEGRSSAQRKRCLARKCEELGTFNNTADHGGGCDEQVSSSRKESGGHAEGFPEKQDEDWSEQTKGETYWLWSPCLSGLQGHERGVVRQRHEELVGVHLCTVLLANQRQRHSRQGQQQRLAYLQHREQVPAVMPFLYGRL